MPSYGVKTYCFSKSSLRQFNPESASEPNFAFNSNLPCHPLDRPPHDRQSDPRPLKGAISMCALKQVKNLRLGVRLNSDAIVFKPKPHGVAHGFSANADSRTEPWRGEFHRIIQ